MKTPRRPRRIDESCRACNAPIGTRCGKREWSALHGFGKRIVGTVTKPHMVHDSDTQWRRRT